MVVAAWKIDQSQIRRSRMTEHFVSCDWTSLTLFLLFIQETCLNTTIPSPTHTYCHSFSLQMSESSSSEYEFDSKRLLDPHPKVVQLLHTSQQPTFISTSDTLSQTSPLLTPPLPVRLEPAVLHSLSLPELLNHPEVHNIYINWSNSARQLVELQTMNIQLQQENQRLNRELQLVLGHKAVHAGVMNTASNGEFTAGYVIFRTCAHPLGFLNAAYCSSFGAAGLPLFPMYPTPPIYSIPTPSMLIPNKPQQSIEQVTGKSDDDDEIPLSLQRHRPLFYPKSVLWTFEEAKADQQCSQNGSNRSKPNMRTAIRNTKGKTVSLIDWLQIQSAARQIIENHLYSIPIPSHLADHVSKHSRTMKYFENHFRTQWKDALVRLEKEEKYLRLCADNWKASHVYYETTGQQRKSWKTSVQATRSTPRPPKIAQLYPILAKKRQLPTPVYKIPSPQLSLQVISVQEQWRMGGNYLHLKNQVCPPYWILLFRTQIRLSSCEHHIWR